MKPLSKEAVKRLALAQGAKLEIDGQKVNTARLKVVTKQPQKPAYMPEEAKPEPQKTIEQPRQDPAIREAIASIDNYAASQFLINESNARFVEAVKEMLAQQKPVEPEKRPTQWVFKVKRDAHGLMESITATAKF